MTASPVLHIRQDAPVNGQYPIRLTLRRADQAPLEAQAHIAFALTPQEHEDLRWYLEDYLQKADSTTDEHVQQVEAMLHDRGVELYEKILEGNRDAQRVFDRVLDELAELRIEIATEITEAAAIPWELMREPQSDSPIALRVQAFIRVQSNPNLSFVHVPPSDDGRVRLLYVVCRPSGTHDVELRAIVNRLLQDLKEDVDRFDITALRPPTYERLQQVLTDAKQAGRPFHIVHFDGHGVYADLTKTKLADWAKLLSSVMLGGEKKGKHGYLLFEHPESEEKMRPVPGDQLGKLLRDTGVPVLVLNACQSAMHEATASSARVSDPAEDATEGLPADRRPSVDDPWLGQRPATASDAKIENVHDEVRAIGSLAQAIVDQGVPAVLGMRYKVYVVTAAQYVGELYRALAKGRGFGEAATEGRKHLHANPERWVGLEPRPLQDWFVPVVYEAMPLHLLSSQPEASARDTQTRRLADASGYDRDPIQRDPTLLRYVPDTGFVGRDETLLLLDRAFDAHAVVLLHAYAGQGKTSTAVEFARWYAQTGGLGPQPVVLFSSFETQHDLADVLNQIGQEAIEDWSSINQLAEKRQQVLQLLRHVPVLWIWDNVEPVAGFPEGTPSLWTADEQRELADFLKLVKLDRSTKVKILLTSRRDEQRWLGGVPYRVKMPRMRRSDAARLAVSLGTERQLTRGEIAAWQPLLDYCAGNPLTLRVIAGQAVRMGLRGEQQIAAFVQAVRDGEQQIEDADATQGRDKSLGASLDYGFRHAFTNAELPIVALLHLFQGTVDIDVLKWMGEVGEFALPELQGRTQEQLAALLNRCSETGLLTPLGGTWYAIHPALPWFLRQLFARFFPLVARSVSEGEATVSSVSGESLADASGYEDRRSTATAALRAWVEAVGELSEYYHRQFNEGNRDVIQLLELNEANLLHARRLAHRHRWWLPVVSAMQGLRSLYEYEGRMVQWSRLVVEIVPDYCTADDQPVPGHENCYSVIMGYRVDLARKHDHNLPQAAALQEKRVAWNRQQAAVALALPSDAPLAAAQRNRIRTLAMSMGALGQILSELGRGDCVAAYEESVRHARRIHDKAAEAISHFNLGHAYKDLPAIRNLHAAEAAYQQSLDVWGKSDLLNRSKAIQGIGMVHHVRFKEAQLACEDEDTVLRHARAAESHYQQALALCPATAITDLGPIHNQLGLLYDDVGQTEQAREHFEKRVQIAEQTGDRYRAGTTRFNMALMYLQSSSEEITDPGQRDLVLRARSYAAAALRDFQHYEGRAAADEANAQRLIDHIDAQLG